MAYIEGEQRNQHTLFPTTLDELISEDHVCRVIEAFVGRLDMAKLGFVRSEPAEHSSRAPNWVSFQIKDGSTTLTKGSPEFPASDVAEWSDEKLSQMIEVVTGGLVRKSA